MTITWTLNDKSLRFGGFKCLKETKKYEKMLLLYQKLRNLTELAVKKPGNCNILYIFFISSVFLHLTFRISRMLAHSQELKQVQTHSPLEKRVRSAYNDWSDALIAPACTGLHM